MDHVSLRSPQQVLEGHDRSEASLVPDSPDGGERMNSAREDAEGSLHFLNCISAKPAILLARAWRPCRIPFVYEQMDLYREVAAASNCTIVEFARPEAGGLNHLVFAARVPGLTNAEYLACLEGSEPWA